ncbi:hypothetical protein JJQ72_07460 [Paenibacillus sp. F411]|uniref:Uncharacterized protein n=1 Tax=Paenibacillus algicola TaxID=2565926 RepID=A0A4P8XMN9_9BACL|nr:MULTISPECIES: hypothetical protein [Paenibacillus]MBO2943810.1 hypothetical protein [Paenibacillus sp. F411]QCT04097.1 hypothetical protein E6C60_3386 [Paenibacillus algicola]
MNKERETGTRINNPQPNQEPKSLDIHAIMSQMGIHPDKWKQHLALQEDE